MIWVSTAYTRTASGQLTERKVPLAVSILRPICAAARINDASIPINPMLNWVISASFMMHTDEINGGHLEYITIKRLAKQ